MDDAEDLALEAAQAIAAGSGAARHAAVVVLGSGWAAALAALGEICWRMPAGSLPGFHAPTAVGHAGEVCSLDLDGHRVLVLSGRTHLYEGHGTAAVAHGVRTAAAAGARTAVLTNANGSLRSDWPPGTGVVLTDHLNLTAMSPLVGARFVDLTRCWSPHLATAALATDPALVAGTYAMLPGPHYQSLAESRMLRSFGADVVGMSAVLEAIAACALGMSTLGLSVVTTVELDDNGEHPALNDPDEVVEIAAASATRLGAVIRTTLASELHARAHDEPPGGLA